MSPADGPVVVWHLRGALDVTTPPGLGQGEGARWGVVLKATRRDAGGVALGADQVEGVMARGEAVAVDSEWLGGLDLRHLTALLRLEDGRLATLLNLDSLFPEP